MLCRSYEHLLLRAALDPSFGRLLVDNPSRVTKEAGYSPLVSESLVGLRERTLSDFAGALHRRVYGSLPLRADAVYQRPETERRPDAVYRGVAATDDRAEQPRCASV